MLCCRCREERHIRPRGSSFTRVLNSSSPTARYDPKKKRVWATTHWGQMKLLLSEIEFLTPYYGKEFHVIYAGASPGVHIPVLARMFPTMKFILVDPQPSMMTYRQCPNTEVVEARMTNELAREFASRDWGGRLLFISDVRTGENGSSETDEEQQERIHRDMMAQKEWVEILQPKLSVLKFRLPWAKGCTEYLNGKIHQPVYGKQLTHETRLFVPRGAKTIEYDHGMYEGQMAFFNQVIRHSLYYFAGRSMCFDCTSFRRIVGEYMRSTAGRRIRNEEIDHRCHEIEIELNERMHQWRRIRDQQRSEPGT